MESGSKTLLLQEITLPVPSHHLPCHCLDPAGHSQVTIAHTWVKTGFDSFAIGTC